MIYLISYDLSTTIDQPTTTAQVLEELHKIGEVNACLKSSWLLQTEAGLNRIYDAVRSVTNEADRFFVAPIVKEKCVGVTTRDDHVWDWLKTHE